MSSSIAVVPPVSIVIRWPHALQAGGGPTRLARQLNDQGMSATWAIEEPQQVDALRATVGKTISLDLALLICKPDKAALAGAASRMASFDAFTSISSLAIDGDLTGGAFERTLRQAGIRVVVVGAAKASATGVRSLPFGIIEFRPHVEAPAKNRLLPFGGIARRLDASKLTSVAVVNIDLSRGASSRAIAQLIAQVADAVADGVVRLATISQLASEFSRQSAPRPQRSILRAAA